MKIREWMWLAGVAVLAMPVQAETVVIANVQNANLRLTSEQVLKIFMGKVTSLPNGVKVKPLDQPDGSVRDAFYLTLTGKSAAQIKTYWSRQMFTGQGQPPAEASSVEEVLKLVGKDPNLIGYVDKALLRDNPVIVLLALGGNRAEEGFKGEDDSISVYK